MPPGAPAARATAANAAQLNPKGDDLLNNYTDDEDDDQRALLMAVGE